MLKKIFCLVPVLIILFSCTSNHQAYTKFLNRDSLPSQFITIDNNRDTAIQTANGAILNIQKGSFSSDHIKLQVKEPYSIEQMVLAGLTTESDGKPLSSGGMIYINAVDKDVKINKAIHVSIPTNYYDNRMQVYRGEEKDGKINWTDPKPLANNDSLPPYLQQGKLLFEQNCASCHALDKDLVAPALSGVENRGPWSKRNRLIEFTNDPPAVMAHNCYLLNLKNKYGAMMIPFPQLDANAIYDYIRNEDYKKGIVYATQPNETCEDSCWRYDSVYRVINKIQARRSSLIDSNGERINFNRQFPSIIDGNDNVISAGASVDKVEPVHYKAIYYQFEINTFDWYNVDFLMDESGAKTELKVEMQGQYKNNMSVFLIVPDQKVFVEGGPLTGKTNEFGFYTKDGKIPLPVGSNVIVFAVGEADGQITFDFKKFVSTDKQRIVLEPKTVSKKEFNRAVRKFRLDNASIEVKDSKNAGEIRKADKEIKSNQSLLELYRPKNCNCDCGADSVLEGRLIPLNTRPTTNATK